MALKPSQFAYEAASAGRLHFCDTFTFDAVPARGSGVVRVEIDASLDPQTAKSLMDNALRAFQTIKDGGRDLARESHMFKAV